MSVKYNFWTPDKVRLAYPTRKKRRKFFSRWRKQHRGHNFCWYKSEYIGLIWDEMAPFTREDFDKCIILFKR